MMGTNPSPPGLAGRLVALPAGAWAALAVAAALLASYYPSVHNLVLTWMAEPNYSHGFLVAPIAAFILWMRRDALPRVVIRPSLVGWLGLLAILAARVWLFERNEMWVEEATIPLAAACLVLAFGGWGLLWWAAPGLLFLPFLLPLPPRLNLVAAGPLQTMATIASAAILRMTGLPVLREGHVIFVGSQPLEVARACSGLSMLMSFAALVTAMTIIQRERPMWERVVLLLSTVPIALLVNILRIVGTGWAYHALGIELGEKWAHDAAGWLMMPAALGFVVLELKILSWLIITEDVSDRPVVFLPQSQPRPARPIKGDKPKPAAGGNAGVGE